MKYGFLTPPVVRRLQKHEFGCQQNGELHFNGTRNEVHHAYNAQHFTLMGINLDVGFQVRTALLFCNFEWNGSGFDKTYRAANIEFPRLTAKYKIPCKICQTD